MRIISEEAEAKNISDNALIDSILQKWVIFDRHLEDYPLFVVSQSIITSLLDKISIEDISEIGYSHGSTTPRSVFIMQGFFEPTVDSVIWFLENNHAKYSKWFTMNHHIVDGKNMIHLRHNAGAKWSRFLSTYMKGLFMSVLDQEIEVEETSFYVNIRV